MFQCLNVKTKKCPSRPRRWDCTNYTPPCSVSCLHQIMWRKYLAPHNSAPNNVAPHNCAPNNVAPNISKSQLKEVSFSPMSFWRLHPLLHSVLSKSCATKFVKKWISTDIFEISADSKNSQIAHPVHQSQIFQWLNVRTEKYFQYAENSRISSPPINQQPFISNSIFSTAKLCNYFNSSTSKIWSALYRVPKLDQL